MILVYTLPVMLFCFAAAIVCVANMYLYLRGKERKILNTKIPWVIPEYLAVTLDEKDRPGIWLLLMAFFAFVSIVAGFISVFWGIKIGQ